MVLLLLLLLATWCLGHFTWLAGPVEATEYLPLITKEYTPPDYELEALEAYEVGEEGIGASLEWHGAKVLENLGVWLGFGAGGIPIEVAQGPNGPIYARRGGASNALANLTSNLYSTQPASSVEYLADLGHNLGLVPRAYAQGMSWHALSPVLSLWKAFRNIAYLAFVIVFVVIGFMIMFRKKVDPQTVISLQNALPKIIVTLVLITFSYAIAGFIIDLGQLLTRIIGNTFVDQELILVIGDEFEKQEGLQKLLNADIFRLISPLLDVGRLLAHLRIAGIPSISGLAKIPIVSDIMISAIFWLSTLFIMFKIFFALIGPYISIILSVIFAPLQLMIGAIPGRNTLGGWLKQLVANIAVFPVTFAMIAIAAVMKGYTKGTFLAEGVEWDVLEGKYTLGWYPSVIGNWGEVVGDLICFGILFTVPKVVQMIQAAFQIQPQPWAAAAGEEVRAGVGRIPFIGDFIARRMGQG